MLKLRKRHRIRRKEIMALAKDLEGTFGCSVFTESDHVDVANAPDYQVVIVDAVAVAIIVDQRPVLTVKGIIKYEPTRSFVEVDMGAIPYVMNGADIMAPGIVVADDGIQVEDLVWIRDERNRKPLAIGRALIAGPDMVASRKGKAVKTIHHVGDDLWELET